MTGGAEGIDYIGKCDGVLLEFCHRGGERKFDNRGSGNDIYDSRGQAHIVACLAVKIVRKHRSKAGVELERLIGRGAGEPLLDQGRWFRRWFIGISFNEFDADAAGEIGRHDRDRITTGLMARAPE